MFCRERPGRIELDMELLDPSDAAETLAAVSPGEVVYFGTFPAIEDDGIGSIAFIPPDEDGLIRPRPV